MKATQSLHNLGQSIWLDNITRELLDSGTLKRYIDDLGADLQAEGAKSFDDSWQDLLTAIEAKSKALR